MIYWEKSVIAVTDLQNTPDFYPVSHNDSIPWHSCSVLIDKLCLCAIFPLLYGNSPEITRGAFSLASSCHVMCADTWRGLGDVCIAQEAVTTLLFIFCCSSPALCHAVKALGLHSACHSYCWGHSQITSLRLLSQLNIHLKNVVTYTSQRSSEIK